MRRAAAWLMLSGAALFGVKAVGAGGSALKWTAVELLMTPRSDDATATAWKVRLQADGAGMYSEGTPADTKQMPLTVSASHAGAAEAGRARGEERQVRDEGQECGEDRGEDDSLRG